jgi:hypothetical protein
MIENYWWNCGEGEKGVLEVGLWTLTSKHEIPSHLVRKIEEY